MYHYQIVRFRHRSVIEMLGREDTHTQEERLETHRELETILPLAEAEMRRLENVRSPAIASFPLDARYEHNSWAGWYGVEADEPVPVSSCARNGDRTVIRIGAHGCCRVRTDDITVEDYTSFRAGSSQALFVPVPLADGPVAAELLDPVRSFFRRPDEAGFWERITADWCDPTARLVYADWLDEHDDPHAGVFRHPAPFADAYLRFDWVGAARRVGPQLIGRQRTLWEFAGSARSDRGVGFTLADGAPVPPFVAYLLGVSRLRAEGRLSADDRDFLTSSAERVGWAVEGDLLVGGHNGEVVCRVADPVRTAARLRRSTLYVTPTDTGGPYAVPLDDEESGDVPDSFTAALVASLRAANGGGDVPPPTRVEYPLLPGVTGSALRRGDLDPLTGVGNRGAFDTVLAEVLRRRTDGTFPLSALSLDLDRFGAVNSTHGHTAADRALAGFARLVWATLGDRGFVARTTGDGFTVLLPHFGADKAFGVGEELRRVVERRHGAGGGGAVTLTVSVGVAEYASDQNYALRDVAEEAVRRAKAAGRNRVSF
ncbi:diguanylate cyclase [Gemmata sp. JC717]|uniref:GGDEF domain-containing protein n=1 Tax=Gemmata algarum TaxID=2975278 RepID=UPI0021BAF2E3|nr:diguanylate cyclase [Gemmata algarum]MDY3556168.1 diguanylate cyclase [Gemmata algarum]